MLFYFGYTLKRSARLIGYFILDFYYWCNLDYHFSREKIAALLTPVCAEMTNTTGLYQISDVAHVGSIQGYLPSAVFRAFILNVLLLRKWTLVSETGKAGGKAVPLFSP